MMKYQGSILDGFMHGEGRLTYENGEYYDGQWVRGIFLQAIFGNHLFALLMRLIIQAKGMEEENTAMPMGPNTLVIGTTIASMEKELAGIPMETSTINYHLPFRFYGGWIIQCIDIVDMKANGATEESMVKVLCAQRMVMSIAGSGKMQSGMESAFIHTCMFIDYDGSAIICFILFFYFQ